MVIALDIDGCLANFNNSYAKRLVKVTGENRFPTPLEIPCWDWDKHYGYTNEEIAATWDSIIADRLFWQKLDTLVEPDVFTRINVISKTNPVYFITNRVGLNCKQQTEKWLYEQGINYPTVLIAANKRPIIESLKIEFFVDDRLETMNELVGLKRPHFYLAETTYNQTGRLSGVAVASDVKDALTKAGLW